MCILGCVQTSQSHRDHEYATSGDISSKVPTIIVSPTIDVVYAFAHALHNMTAEMCNYTYM